MKRKLTLFLSVVILFSAFGYGIFLTANLHQRLEELSAVSSVYDRHGHLIGNIYDHRRIWVSLDQIPPKLQQAVIAVEDTRFYRHIGIDPIGIFRALWHNLLPGGSLEGGSTITQQLAKTVMLTPKRTLLRKAQDLLCALGIEVSYSKDEILELYLNSIYLGHGNIGVEAACRYYFGKSVPALTLEECALMAGLINSPENYSPLKYPERALQKRNIVLRRMQELGSISSSEYQKASSSKLSLVKRQAPASTGAYFLDYIREYLVEEAGFSQEGLCFGGYKIYTTLDLAYQKEAERIFSSLPEYTAKTQPQVALVTLDPRTGEILAMVGSRSYAQSQLNRSVKALRQPGSAIKPFLYATAIENGFTAASIFEDQPVEISLRNGQSWRPENYDHSYRGPITLRVALRDSVNTVAVQLLQAVGVKTVADQIEKMGITTLVQEGEVNDLSPAPLALGGLTKGVTPLELAASFTPFPNQGKYAAPYPVKKIMDRNNELVQIINPSAKKPVLSPQTAFIMTMLMKDVVDKGTGQAAALPDRSVAGKTGTTSNNTNAWFIGFTPDLLTVIWIGNDRQEDPMIYKEGRVSSETAARLWGGYMGKITQNHPVRDFTEPPGIVWADVNPETGKTTPGWLSRNSYKEVFAEENIPRGSVDKLWNDLFGWLKPKKNAPRKTEEE